MKQFYLKWRNVIVVVLFVLLCMTKCSSCMNRRAGAYTESALYEQIDSLKTVCSGLEIENRTHCDSLNYVIERQRQEIQHLQDGLKVIKDTNSKLWKTNKNLIEKSNSLE